MKFLQVAVAFALALGTASAALCADGKTQCSGCQCCPDGYLCPDAPTTGSCPDTTCPKGRATSSGSSGSNNNSGNMTNNNGVCTSTVYVTKTVTPGSGSSSTATTVPTAGGSSTSTASAQPTGPASNANSHTITIYNKCSYPVYAGFFGTTLFKNGGWLMQPGQVDAATVPLHWSGRIWGRTGCTFDANGNGSCETGDCGGLQCAGRTGQTPATLAEITFDGAGGLDFYDVSLVDGYNIPMTFGAVAGTFKGSQSQYDCTQAGCTSDLLTTCPTELQKTINGRVVGCLSACEKFQTDAYCCRGANGTPSTCNPNTWPTNYAQIFKNACPAAYSYAYDDKLSTFTCNGNPEANYYVTFCY